MTTPTRRTRTVQNTTDTRHAPAPLELRTPSGRLLPV